MKLKGEVGMGGSKSTQTRFVGIVKDRGAEDRQPEGLKILMKMVRREQLVERQRLYRTQVLKQKIQTINLKRVEHKDETP